MFDLHRKVINLLLIKSICTASHWGIRYCWGHLLAIAIYLAFCMIVLLHLYSMHRHYQRFNSIIPVIERVEKYTEFE